MDRAAGRVACVEPVSNESAGVPASFPALYDAADEASQAAQQWFLRLSAWRLWALISVAAFAASAELTGRWAPILAVGLIIVALTCELILLILRPERQWHEGRAVAESVRTLAWRFQVGGRPFGVRLPAAEVEESFATRLMHIVDEFPDLSLAPARRDQLTASMRDLRSLPLDGRRAAYRDSRVQDQLTWYAAKADWNHRRARAWQVGLVLLESLALFAAFFTALDLLPLDTYGLLSAIAIAGVGWLQIKEHRRLAGAYAVASHGLAAINSRLDRVNEEEAWEEFVDQAEEAISREHSLWRASH